MIMAGATPKLTTSARLSSSMPKLLLPPSFLAILPSMKSKNTAKKTSHEAGTKWPWKARTRESMPLSMFPQVIMLGTRVFIGTGLPLRSRLISFSHSYRCLPGLDLRPDRHDR